MKCFKDVNPPPKFVSITCFRAFELMSKKAYDFVDLIHCKLSIK